MISVSTITPTLVLVLLLVPPVTKRVGVEASNKMPHATSRRQHQLLLAVRRAFQPRHRCIAVLDSTGAAKFAHQVIIGLLLEHAPLPVVVVRSDLNGSLACPDCGRKVDEGSDLSNCGGVLVLSESYESAVFLAACRARATPSSESVLLLTTGRPREGADVQALGTADATAFIWSTGELWRLSDPYLTPRLWRRDDVGHYREGGGRRRYDFNGRVLRVATFHQPPISYIDDPTDPRKVYGTEWAVLGIIAQHLNWTWSLFISNCSDKWGKPDGNTSWKGGNLGALVDKKADLALNVWVQMDQARVVDLTTYTRLSCQTFMVPRPHMLGATADAVFLPLQSPVWKAWLLSIAVATLACRLLHAADKKLGVDRVATDGRFSTLDRCLHTLVGSSVTTYIPPSTASLGPHRHVIAWWVVFSVLMTTAFSSGLIAHLTLQRSEPPINTPQDIVDKGLRWVSGFVPNFHVMMNLENPAEKTLADGLVVVRPSNWERTVASRKFVVHGQKLDNFYFFWYGGDLGDATLHTMRLMKSCLANYPTSIALHRGSPFLRPFNWVITRLREGGLVDYWQRLVVTQRGREAVYSLLVDDHGPTGPKVLKLSQLWSAFMVLLYGLLLSSFVFILECLARAPSRNGSRRVAARSVSSTASRPSSGSQLAIRVR